MVSCDAPDTPGPDLLDRFIRAWPVADHVTYAVDLRHPCAVQQSQRGPQRGEIRMRVAEDADRSGPGHGLVWAFEGL